MLTADLVKPKLRLRGSELFIDLLNEHDPCWLQAAKELIDLFRKHMDQSLEAWDKALETYLGDRIDYIVVRGLAKVLTDAATFTPIETPLPPAQLRERLFAYGPTFATPQLFHPQTRYEIVKNVADELAITPEQVEATLFADRPATYLLSDAGPEWAPEVLLARYNLELARGVLYWASNITIEAASNYKDLWKYIKFFKLMFWAEPKHEGGYRIDLDGPISPFVSSTLRYGRQMAAFLPALFHCEQWNMVAAVHPPQAAKAVTYRLDSHSSFRSHFKQSSLFDSRLEADFAGEFEQKMGRKRGHWRLERESELLLLGDTVMVPDFVLIDTKDEHRRILIELVGFWHPNYLRRKVDKVRAANCAHLLLLVYKGLNITEGAFSDVASEVIFFSQKPVLKEVMEAVEEMANHIYGPRQKHQRNRKNNPTAL